MFSLNVLSMITLKYSTQALSRLVCAYTFKLPHVWDISRVGWGRGGGGVHTSHIVKTLVSVELTSVLRLVRATSYNTRACVIAGGSRHSINTSTCTWQRYATLHLQTYNILVPFCRLFHVISPVNMTNHIVFNMIIYITQVGYIKGEQEGGGNLNLGGGSHLNLRSK